MVKLLFTFTVLASKKLINFFFSMRIFFLSERGVNLWLRESNTYIITRYQNNGFTNLQLLKTSWAILQLNLNINNFAIHCCLFLKWTINFSVDFNFHNIFLWSYLSGQRYGNVNKLLLLQNYVHSIAYVLKDMQNILERMTTKLIIVHPP